MLIPIGINKTEETTRTHAKIAWKRICVILKSSTTIQLSKNNGREFPKSRNNFPKVAVLLKNVKAELP